MSGHKLSRVSDGARCTRRERSTTLSNEFWKTNSRRKNSQGENARFSAAHQKWNSAISLLAYCCKLTPIIVTLNSRQVCL